MQVLILFGLEGAYTVPLLVLHLPQAELSWDVIRQFAGLLCEAFVAAQLPGGGVVQLVGHAEVLGRLFRDLPQNRCAVLSGFVAIRY